jgi:hypothetical protein
MPPVPIENAPAEQGKSAASRHATRHPLLARNGKTPMDEPC